MRDRPIFIQLLAVMLLATTSGCLPAGDPPSGQHIWAGRERSIVGVLPARSSDDGVTRILTLRPNPASPLSDLSLMSATSSGAATETTLVERWSCDGTSTCPGLDSKGRVLAWSIPAGQSLDGIPVRTLHRIDVDTGERTDLGMGWQYQLSPSRQRVAVSAGTRDGDDGVVKVLEGDDESAVEVPHARSPAFVGEDLYLVHDANVLGRLAPGATAIEVVRRGVQFFSVLSTTNGPRLLLHLSATEPATVGGFSLLDPAAGDERPLPFAGNQIPTVSPDGRWAVIHGPDGGRTFTLFEVSTGTEEPLELPVEAAGPEWRPRRAELWFVASNWPDRSAFVKRPGQPLMQLPAAVIPGRSANGSSFNTDGSRLFSFRPTEDDTFSPLFVGDADDPDGARFPLNPRGTIVAHYRDLPDGRLVVEAFYSRADRNDIFLVDPKDGATRLLGTNGGVVSIGPQRVLAMTHRVDQAADLDVIDVDVKQSTRLATEFAIAAFVQPRLPPNLQPGLDDADLARPGAPVVFQFRARFASPHDGFWLTTLP